MILWQGTLIDNLGNEACLRVRVERDTLHVEELDDTWESPTPFWGPCEDDSLSRNALEKTVLTLALR